MYNVSAIRIWTQPNFYGYAWRIVVSDDVNDETSGIVTRTIRIERASRRDAMQNAVWEPVELMPQNVWADLVAKALYAAPDAPWPAMPPNQAPRIAPP